MRPGQAESTEAYDRPWKRVSTAALSLGAEEEQPTARVPGAGGCKGLILLRPLNAGRRLFPRKATCGWFWYFCHQKYRESRDDVAGVLYLFSAKSTDRSLRLVFFAAFWSAKSGAKTDPPTKKAKRRGLTLAPGDYSRVCKQTVPSARAFSPHLFERLFCQAGVVRRGTRREGCVRDKQKAQKPTIAPGSGFKPPHYRLQRRKNNRQPACPEREAA